MRYPEVRLALPDWVDDAVPPDDARFPGPEERMELVVRLARLNVERGTGGPFAAGVFGRAEGRLLAPGVNLVVPARCSAAHAEMVALGVAQRRLGEYDLAASGEPGWELVASTEPCAMCFGAVPWSGVRGLVCGARSADAREIGFDEGKKPADWVGALERRGIRVRRDVRREEARRVLEEYVEGGGRIYNSRRGKEG